ncbi:MAG: NADH-quinone oxidoreductase subunit C [Candidatus Midichloria sp.]|nr:NADH-quinone oxidoreductase subunit C [Candidatus Midichloria sp.]
MQNLESFKDYLLSSDHKHAIINHYIEHNELFVILDLNFLKDFLVFLKTNEKFSFQVLTDLCGVDYPDREDRFQVVYNLLSLTYNLRLTIKINAKEDQLVPSICDIYSAATWYEREAWDMYGIYFSGHPDLRRILTDYGFIGHPMRKDFPLTGFSEVRYDIEKKKVIYEKVKLTQDFRNFDFTSPWEGTDYILPGDEKATK